MVLGRYLILEYLGPQDEIGSETPWSQIGLYKGIASGLRFRTFLHARTG